MRSPGIVDLVFRYKSPSDYGPGLTVDGLTASIYNSLDQLKETLIFGDDVELEEVVAGDTYYRIANFDTSDILNYPGTFVRVAWDVDRPGSPSPANYVFSQSYWYVPVAFQPMTTHVVSWEGQFSPRLAGYYIESKIPSDADYSFLAASTNPIFVDNTGFTNVPDYIDVSYRVFGMLWGPSPGSPGPLLGNQLSPVSVSLFTDKLCLVYGSIKQIDGTVHDVDYVRFFIHNDTGVMNLGPTFLLHDRERVVGVDSWGQFAVPLVQGAVVTCEIPTIGYVKRFIVPAQDTASLASIDGTTIETYRAP